MENVKHIENRQNNIMNHVYITQLQKLSSCRQSYPIYTSSTPSPLELL